MIMDDNDGQMIFGDLGGLKFPDISLTGEEKPLKTSPRKPVPTRDRTWARCVTSVHATTCFTAVDEIIIFLFKQTQLLFKVFNLRKQSMPLVRKSRYWGEMLLSPIRCCYVMKPPYLLSGELCTSPLHSNRLRKCTPSVVGAAVSASLCSEHVILT